MAFARRGFFVSRGPGGKSLVENAQAPGDIAREIMNHDGVLVRHFLEEVVECAGSNFDDPDRTKGADGGRTEDGIHHAHFTKKCAGVKTCQHDTAGIAEIFDDLDIPVDDNKKRMAGFAFANNVIAGRKIVDDGIFAQQAKGIGIQTDEKRGGIEGLEN